MKMCTLLGSMICFSSVFKATGTVYSSMETTVFQITLKAMQSDLKHMQISIQS